MTFLTSWGPKKSFSAQGSPLRYIHAVNFLIRSLLIWLLVLAVPAQGMAAVTMAVCGPNHAGARAAAQSPSVVSIERVDQDENPASTHVHRDRTTQELEDLSASAEATSSVKVGDVSPHTCSACASCCSAAAILSTVLAVPAAAHASTVFSAVVPSVDTYAADGQDRPPRIVLA